MEINKALHKVDDVSRPSGSRRDASKYSEIYIISLQVFNSEKLPITKHDAPFTAIKERCLIGSQFKGYVFVSMSAVRIRNLTYVPNGRSIVPIRRHESISLFESPTQQFLPSFLTEISFLETLFNKRAYLTTTVDLTRQETQAELDAKAQLDELITRTMAATENWMKLILPNSSTSVRFFAIEKYDGPKSH